MRILGSRSSASPSPAPSPSPLPHNHHHHNNNHHSSFHFHRPPLDSGASSSLPSTSSPSTVEFSPPLIAMVVVVAASLLFITYSRLIYGSLVLLLRRYRRQHRRFPISAPSSTGGGGERLDSPPPYFDSPDEFHHLYFHNYGLDESVIKTIPISLYTKSPPPQAAAATRDCAVCLLEFEHGHDYVRTLPNCSHKFHVDCIDIWLRSHANCPLCRSRIFLPSSSTSSPPPPPFVPLMAARIRPSFVENPNFLLPDLEFQPSVIRESEITPCVEEEDEEEERIGNDFGSISRRNNDFSLLKRSYSFGFERSERLMTPATVSPYRSSRRSISSSKRPSPFGSYLSKPRLFSSFRYYYKSPFSRRRGGGGSSVGGFIPLSERFGSGGYSRRSKSMTSPRFFRPSSSSFVFSSSRLRCGDPEALISPERYSRR
ncbi:RING-H2 finger protein ATL65 [Linum grandiflorum]